MIDFMTEKYRERLAWPVRLWRVGRCALFGHPRGRYEVWLAVLERPSIYCERCRECLSGEGQW